MKTKNLSLDLEKWRKTWWCKRERKAWWNDVLELVQSKKPREQVERAASNGSGNSSSTVTRREVKVYRSRFRWVSSCDVTKSQIQLLATLKPIKSQGWWKGKVAYFRGQQPEDGAGSNPQTNSPTTNSQWAKVFIDRGMGRQSETAQSALRVEWVVQ